MTETVWWGESTYGYAAAHASTTTWTYDDLGRLVDEVIDHYDDLFDQTERFAYDLTGNRLRRLLDRGSDGAATPDEVTVYAYDANDRLKTENLDATGDGVADQTTTYDYDHTQQTLKEVRVASVVQSKTTFAYDFQGRMAVVTVTPHAGGAANHVERTTYEYDADGIRVGALNEVDADADGTYESATKTEYLNDPDNPTGYSQVLKETTLVGGQIQKTIVYAIGHAVISQTTTEYSGGLPGSPTTLVLGRDGHGSTRLLTDLAGAVATFTGARQIFDYTAHGELLNLDASRAATSLLYSGEMFDARIGMQYLRARWYDPSTGRFNRLDPFFGNTQDPQSLHKYLYVHGDPVNGIDPAGLEFSLVGSMMGSTIAANITAIEGGTFGYVESLARQNIHSFGDFAWANLTLAAQGLFPGIMSALSALDMFAGVAAYALLPFLDRVGFDIFEYDGDDPASRPADSVAFSASSSPAGGNKIRSIVRSFSLPKSMFNLHALTTVAHQTAAFYEALVALHLIAVEGHEIPDRGWGHHPTDSSTPDVVSIDQNGRVYIYNVKGSTGARPSS